MLKLGLILDSKHMGNSLNMENYLTLLLDDLREANAAELKYIVFVNEDIRRPDIKSAMSLNRLLWEINFTVFEKLKSAKEKFQYEDGLKIKSYMGDEEYQVFSINDDEDERLIKINVPAKADIWIDSRIWSGKNTACTDAPFGVWRIWSEAESAYSKKLAGKYGTGYKLVAWVGNESYTLKDCTAPSDSNPRTSANNMLLHAVPLICRMLSLLSEEREGFFLKYAEKSDTNLLENDESKHASKKPENGFKPAPPDELEYKEKPLNSGEKGTEYGMGYREAGYAASFTYLPVNLFRKVFSNKDQWFLNLYEKKDEWMLSKSIYPPEGRYWADCFVVNRKEKSFVFIEDFVYGTSKGHISVLEIEEGIVSNYYDRIIERPYHLSYPFIFEYRDKWYMIPETGGNRSMELYECTGFPDKWQFSRYLMKDVDLVDTTLFPHNGLWWMFTSTRNKYLNRHTSCLDLYYSEDPLSDHWTAHPMNPIVYDIRSSRMAGNIIVDETGAILRPAQDCSARYGHAIRIRKITELSKTGYKEVFFKDILPDGKLQKGILGHHTISCSGSVAVIDAVRKKPW